MAAPMEMHTVNVYLDDDMNVFLDEERTQRLLTPLYQPGGDPNSYFLNQGLTVRVQVFVPERGTDDSTKNIEEEASSNSSSASQIQANGGFTRDQTLFLIDLMRRQLEADGSESPQSLAELNNRIWKGKSSKEQMWRDMAGQLSDHFGQLFDPDKVNRKWNTLVDAYKKIKDNNRSTGRGTMRFKFYNEMESVSGRNYDVEFPVVGTSEGIEIHRPELVNEGEQLVTVSQSSPCPQGIVVSTPRPKQRPQKKSLVEVLQESEAASQRRHEELISQTRVSQVSFETLMREYLSKP